MWGCREWSRQTRTSLTICLLIPLAFIKIAWGRKKGKNPAFKKDQQFHSQIMWMKCPLQHQNKHWRWEYYMLTVSQPLTHGNSASKCCAHSNFMEKFPSRAAASCQYWPFTAKGFKNNFTEPAVCRAEGPHSVSDAQSQRPSPLQQGGPAWESGSGPAPASAPSSASVKIWWAGSRVTKAAPGDFARSTLESAQMNYSVSAAWCETPRVTQLGEGDQHRAGGHCPQKLF